MQIDARLQAIAKFVPQGARLADIGTDHAYLPAFLLKEKKIAFAIAADVAAAPCKVAKTTLAMQGVSAVAQVRQGDGLKVLRPGECDTIVMAGMGGTTIMEILTASPEVAKSAKRLILQPMIAADKLRRFLEDEGYGIVAEDLVEDGKYLYEIIVAAAGAPVTVADGAGYLLGPKLLQEQHPLLSKQIAKQKDILLRVCAGMEQSPEAMNSDKYKETKCLSEMLSKL